MVEDLLGGEGFLLGPVEFPVERLGHPLEA
jgi:hypothetical protein